MSSEKRIAINSAIYPYIMGFHLEKKSERKDEGFEIQDDMVPEISLYLPK